MSRMTFFFLATALAAQQQPAEKKGSISGVVVNAMTKEPVRRAEVSVSGGGGNRVGSANPLMSSSGPPFQTGLVGPRRASTDAEGKFTITDLGAGSYTLSARRNGLLDARYGAKGRTSPGAQIAVSEGQEVTGIRIEMMPQSVITGRVIDEEGEALQGVMVQLSSTQTSSRVGGRGMRPMGSNGRTDDRGEFRIASVSPGTYTLQIIPTRGPAPASPTGEGTLGYAPMYYPGVYDPTQAEKIKVGVGAELSGFQMRLQKTRVYKVQGMVLDADGQPPRGYFVTLAPKGSAGFIGLPSQFIRTKEGGFELQNVPSGSYNLVVRIQGGPRQTFYREPLEVGSQDIQNLSIRIPAPVQLAGQVLALSSTQPTIELSRVRVNLIDAEGGMGFAGPGGQIQTKQDGSFTIDNVSPGKYRINVSLPQDAAYLESVRFGEQDVTGQEITVTPGGGSIRVMLGANGGSVTGTVSADGNPFPGATIVLLPVRKELRDQPFLRTTSTDQNASFTFKNIAPGDYLLLGFEEYDASVLDDENQFAIIERKAKKISIGKGASEAATLELIRSTT